MKKKNTALAGALLLVLAGWSAADAAEIYTLDPVIVTAERTDTKELKTPAAVEIITDKQIRETGAANMQEALQQPGAPRSLPGDNDGKGGHPRR